MTEGAAGSSNRSADWHVSMVNRPRVQCIPSWKKPRKRFGHARTTLPIMRFWPSSMPTGGGKASYRDDSSRPLESNRDKKEAWDALTADVNAVSWSRRKPDELKKKWQKLASEARSDLAKRKTQHGWTAAAERKPLHGLDSRYFRRSVCCNRRRARGHGGTT